MIAAPGFTKALWPTGDGPSQTFQIGQLDQNLATISNQTSNMLNQGLGMLMSDAASFIAFAGYGRYSGAAQLSLPNTTANLDLALKTYLTSESMRQNGWYAGLVNTSVNGRGCSSPETNLYRCPDKTIWLSPESGQKYSILQKTKGTSNGLLLMQQIVSYYWADLITLFDGAYNCTLSGKFCILISAMLVI